PDAPRRPARRPRQRQLGGQLLERLLPFVAPDVQVDVDDVVEGDSKIAEPVADRERPWLVERLEMPDDPMAALDRRLAEAVRRAARAELRGGARRVAEPLLLDRDVADPFAVTKRDVAVRAGE